VWEFAGSRKINSIVSVIEQLPDRTDTDSYKTIKSEYSQYNQ